MLDLNILKNPIVVAILMGALAYLYQYWENEQLKKNGDQIKKINYGIIMAVTAVSGVLAYFLFGQPQNEELIIDPEILEQNMGVPLPNNNVSNTFIPHQSVKNDGQTFIQQPPVKIGGGHSIDTAGSGSYHLIGRKGIKLPATDVFIDIAKF